MGLHMMASPLGRSMTSQPSSADRVHVGAGAQRDILAVEGDQLGDPQPGLDRKREHGVVAPAGPGALAAGGEQCVDLGLDEVGQQVAVIDWPRQCNIAQRPEVELGIDLGCVGRTVAKHLTDLGERSSVTYHRRGQAVPE
jgi:hypothetical protein